MRQIQAALVLLLVPIMVFANNIQCNLPFLVHGFNMRDYNQCQTLIHQCPNNGPIPEYTCVEKISQKNSVCAQINALSKVVNMDIPLLEAQQTANFTVVKKYFLADGQEQFYILTPQNCLIDTNIDPRKFNKDLAKKYPNTQFLIVNWKNPQYQVNKNGTQNFRVLLRITNTCLACSVTGFAEMKFNFTKDGKFTGIVLESFKKKLS